VLFADFVKTLPDIDAERVCGVETCEHDLHGFVYPIRKDGGTYDPDPVQRKAVADVLDFFGRYM
jgi:hypothetical protein